MIPRRRKPRKGAKPFVPNIDVDKWLASHPESLIECPRQPGGLRLTAASCAKRHKYANDPRYSNIGAEPFNVFVFKMNLKPCRECAIGAELSKKQEQAA